MIEYKGTGYAVMKDAYVINNVIFLKREDAEKLRRVYIEGHPEYKNKYYIKEFNIAKKPAGI